MSHVQQAKKGVPIGWRPRWRLLLAGTLAMLVLGYAVLWGLGPRREGDDPKVLAALQPGMTRQEVEKTLGRPLVPQMGRQGIMVHSGRPNRSSTPGLMEEEGLDLFFDDQGVLREVKGWGFVRPESFFERTCRGLGL